MYKVAIIHIHVKLYMYKFIYYLCAFVVDRVKRLLI